MKEGVGGAVHRAAAQKGALRLRPGAGLACIPVRRVVVVLPVRRRPSTGSGPPGRRRGRCVCQPGPTATGQFTGVGHPAMVRAPDGGGSWLPSGRRLRCRIIDGRRPRPLLLDPPVRRCRVAVASPGRGRPAGRAGPMVRVPAPTAGVEPCPAGSGARSATAAVPRGAHQMLRRVEDLRRTARTGPSPPRCALVRHDLGTLSQAGHRVIRLIAGGWIVRRAFAA